MWLAYRYYFIVLYSGCHRIFFFFLCGGYGYVRIIATNISHRPTFRSTTQHNHCRISLRYFFLLFFRFLPFSAHPIGFHIVNITESIKFKSYNRSNIYIIYIIYIILKLTRYILYWLGTLSSTRKKLSLPLARTHSYPIRLHSAVPLTAPLSFQLG